MAKKKTKTKNEKLVLIAGAGCAMEGDEIVFDIHNYAIRFTYKCGKDIILSIGFPLEEATRIKDYINKNISKLK